MFNPLRQHQLFQSRLNRSVLNLPWRCERLRSRPPAPDLVCLSEALLLGRFNRAGRSHPGKWLIKVAADAGPYDTRK